jgi:hypothetical protein
MKYNFHVSVLELDQFLTKIFTVYIAVYSYLYTMLCRIFIFPDIYVGFQLIYFFFS